MSMRMVLLRKSFISKKSKKNVGGDYISPLNHFFPTNTIRNRLAPTITKFLVRVSMMFKLCSS